MFVFTKSTKWILIVVISMLWLAGGLLAQEKLKCILVSEAEPHATDVPIYDWLLLTYDVDIWTGDDVNNGYWTLEDMDGYAFAFISESVSSSDTELFLGAPIPVFYTECWASKWDITGWVPCNSCNPQYYGSTEQGENQNIVKIVDGSHPLAAGFATNTEVTLVTDTDADPDGNHYYLTYSVPQIEYIPVGVLKADETRIVIFGVEAGTSLFNAENTNDGSLLSQNRTAAVGVFSYSNAYLTADAYTLIQAGIDWILEPTLAIEDEDIAVAPSVFNLEQNYPNPFNPTTKISFSLDKAAHTTLTVYNTIGQEVAILVDKNMNAGNHTVNFDAANLNSGIYFYRLSSHGLTQVRKMMLIK